MCVRQLLSSQRCSAQRMLARRQWAVPLLPCCGHVWQCTVAEPQVQAICCIWEPTAERDRRRECLLFLLRGSGLILVGFTGGRKHPQFSSGPCRCSALHCAPACTGAQKCAVQESVLQGAWQAGSILNSNLRIWQDRRHNRQPRWSGRVRQGAVSFLLSALQCQGLLEVGPLAGAAHSSCQCQEFSQWQELSDGQHASCTSNRAWAGASHVACSYSLLSPIPPLPHSYTSF